MARRGYNCPLMQRIVCSYGIDKDNRYDCNLLKRGWGEGSADLAVAELTHSRLNAGANRNRKRFAQFLDAKSVRKLSNHGRSLDFVHEAIFQRIRVERRRRHRIEAPNDDWTGS
jgi:hypothetical protein